MLYHFDRFSLDPDRRELRRDGIAISIEPKVFDLVNYLLDRRDRVVSRDDLISAVWHGRIVSESALATCINAARAALGDSGDEQRLIKTLPRKGIRFVGDLIGPKAGSSWGLGFAIRTNPDSSAIPGSVGSYGWSGSAGTAFFVDPQESMFAILMTQAPGQFDEVTTRRDLLAGSRRGPVPTCPDSQDT